MRWQPAFLWILLSLAFQVASLALGKVAALRMHTFSWHELFHNGPYFASLLCLGCQALAWPQVLRRFPLIWAYLLTSSLYLAIPLVSHYCFHELVTRRNLLGSLIIMVGILLLVTGGKEQALG